MTKSATMNQETAQTSRENIANIPKRVMPTLTATAQKNHQVGDSHFRILQKIHTEDASQRRVVDGDEVVLYAKYDGYFTDLESTSVTHWKKAKGKSAAANGPNGVLGKIKRSLKKLLKRG